jgi:selenoprotein W-related protein
LADELLKNFEPEIASLELIPSSGGVFEVLVNGGLVYSKSATGRHAANGEVINSIRALVDGGSAAETG